MLTKMEETVLLRLMVSNHVASMDFANGHGGIHRPIPPAMHYDRLIELGFCELVVESAGLRDISRGRWFYVATDKGKVMARMLQSVK